MIDNKIFTCPFCKASLNETADGFICNDCKGSYERSKHNQVDFRLKRQKTIIFDVQIGVQSEIYSFVDKVMLLRENKDNKIPKLKNGIPFHLSKEIVSHFPNPNDNNSTMLDLGCGKGIHREIGESYGYQYYGLDYKTKEADVLGDAQALPFKDNSFNFVISIAVLEHIQHPLVMMKEVYRVLKTGGVFIGSVSFLEPFHEDSFYHHTYLGLINSIIAADFEIEFICPNESWTGITAISQMALFPLLPGIIKKLLVAPLNQLHILYYKIGSVVSRNLKAKKLNRLLLTTGSYYFKVFKK